MVPDGRSPAPGVLLDRCARVLGHAELVADRSASHGEAVVLELAGPRGVRWIAKHARREKKYRQELTAYVEWVPALGAAAPALHSAHDDLRLLVLSRLPGRPVEGTPAEREPEVHRQAGALTRRLHDGATPRADAAFAGDLARRLERYAARAESLLTGEEIAFARARVAALAARPPVTTVPCHLDNQPRNWLADEHGGLSLIDFGNAGRRPWIWDLASLWLRVRPGAPALADAFLAGYGRVPTDDDWLEFESCAAFLGLSTVVWAAEHGDPRFAQEGRRWLRDLMAARGRGVTGECW